MRLRGDPEVDPDLYECIGGSLDGQIRELGRTARYFVTYDAAGGVRERYALQWWVKRDAAGRKLWERECLVLEAG